MVRLTIGLNGWRKATLLGLAVATVLGGVLGAGVAVAGILEPGQLLEQGSSGASVTQLQTRLQELGLYDGPISGIYGPLTAAAVSRYQDAVDLPVDGIFGAGTDAALFDQRLTPSSSDAPAADQSLTLGDRLLRTGDRGSDVRELQVLLNERVGLTTVDGIFGRQTENRVRQLQRNQLLEADGEVGANTLAALRDLPRGTLPDSASSGLLSVPVGRQIPTSSGLGTPNVQPPGVSGRRINNNGPYRVILPTSSNNRDLLDIVRSRSGLVNACMVRSRRGSYIFLGGYENFGEAESARLALRSRRQGLGADARRFNPRIDYVRGDFEDLECLN